MGLESGTYVQDLVSTNPLATDERKEGDNHLRLIKAILKSTFPNAERAFYFPQIVTKTANYTITAAEDNAYLFGTTSGGAFTITLPTGLLDADDAGFALEIIKNDNSANALTIAPSSGLLNGAASLKLYNANDAYLCVWNGTDWIAFSRRSTLRLASITADTTLDENHMASFITVTPASATVTLTLPTAVPLKGQSFYVKLDSDTYDLILDGFSTETIDGETTYTLTQNGDVALILSDGTNWQVVSQRLASTVLGLHTIWIPAYAFYDSETDGPTFFETELSTANVNLKGWGFSNSSAQYAQALLQMPKSWNEGSVYCQFYWRHGTASDNFGVRWGAQLAAVSNDQSLDTSFGTTQEVTDTGGSSNRLYISPVTSAITVGGSPAADDLIILEVYRDPAHAGDTLAASATLLGVKLLFTVDAGTDD